jgi:cellulose synthase/poly-beta-1,6-N-acetylglucosamine synthase-like glycosyltransferase
MLSDWTHWLSQRHPDQLLAFLVALLLTDGPRYALSKIVLCAWDWGREAVRWFCGLRPEGTFTHCPSVCLIVAGYNEAETVEATLADVWGTYPRLEIIVVDDGSTDDMEGVARRFARTHEGVKVLRRDDRGGKSSAMNMALVYTQAEVIVVVDADSSLGANAIWEIVQPLADPAVGAVSGSVVARNPAESAATWFQAYEYLNTILVGRLLAARFGVLSIVSGAFGAFRHSALKQVMGWDVGPPEDLDLTLAIRKLGHKVDFAPHANCYTDVPATWWGLIRQRLRWDRSGVIRNHCRKHLDMACPWTKNFRWSNLFVVLDGWFFSVVCTYVIAAWAVLFCVFPPPDAAQVLLMLFLCYESFEIVHVLTILYYSEDLRHDFWILAIFPFVPFYQLLLLAVRVVATTQELFWRKSFEDNYVPLKVRQATWRW